MLIKQLFLILTFLILSEKKTQEILTDEYDTDRLKSYNFMKLLPETLHTVSEKLRGQPVKSDI